MHTSSRRGPNHQYQTAPAGGTVPNPAGNPAYNLPGPAPNTAGPHRSDLMNKLDPTVDSQSGGVQVLGPGINAATNSVAPVAPGTTTGAHRSRVGNELDPRVDAVQTNTATHGGPHSGTHAGVGTVPATNAPVGTYGANATHPGNTVDPMVDSGRHGGVGAHRSHVPGQNTTIHQGPVVQPGPASRTAGPHRSNLLNKLDPAVNSKETVSQQREYRTG